jgi:putative nucleotidyltransferase with HDIG domain
MKNIKVLFVDDDQSLLDGFRRILRRKVTNWDMRFAASGEEALRLLSQETADVIISDMRMPEMNGVDLLKRVKERYPHIVRFVLSGYSDKSMIFESVGLTHQFFAKPCDPELLIKAVDYSNSLYKHLNSPEIQRVVCGIKSLPTPPAIYTKMIRELNKPEPSIEALSAIVRTDSAISAKVLQLVNSAFFGLRQPIDDLNQATVFLGIENLKSLVLIIGLSEESFKSINKEFALGLYTHHSIQVGSISQEVAKKLGFSQKECQTAFTAGLLHDIGKLVMATHFSKRYCDVMEFHMQTPDTVHTQELETDQFGLNHAEIGAALIGIWGLPPSIVNAVAYHHNPQEDSEKDISLSTIVHIANALALRDHKDPEQPILESDLLNFPHIQSLGLENEVMEWATFDDFE